MVQQRATVAGGFRQLGRATQPEPGAHAGQGVGPAVRPEIQLQMINNLRDFIDVCREIGEVKDIQDADWDEEIGALTEAAAELIDSPPALLFDRVKGYPEGYRVFGLPMASHRRV